AGMALGALGLLALQLVFAVVSWGGLYPQAVQITRPYLDYYRRRAADWTGREYPQPYRPLPAPPLPDETGKYRAGRTLYQTQEAAVRAQRYGWIFTDPATWRDLLWIVLGVPVSVAGFLPALLVGFGLYGLVWQPIVWAPWGIPVGLATGEWVTPWYMGYLFAAVAPPLAAIPGWVTPFLGVVMTGAGLLLAGPLLRLRGAFDRLLLTPTRSTLLAQRVRRLTETRADAVDAQAAELRRIERDLHDGAQARLVSLGLSLATAEQLMERDPEAAKKLLAQARETSATALAELRNLVRGIHPPVLAERGLGDAVRAVALDSPLPADVTVDLPGRLPAPVESAAYFATVEALANAVRHSGAARVRVDIRYDAGASASGVLRITVTDDGRGGADPARGTGLRGVQRRLGTFDGTLSIESPVGGPTVLTMEIPCVLSSPRTSTS
ncbi:MAG TPA: histidine kinase, partial [Micromonosporaceae bacterium]|nr:histidine kinase [Micromonosporaceae bacterium]